jgi:nitric oxide reductase subunit B
MESPRVTTERLSPWWRHSVILVLIFGFTVLITLAVRSYKDAPPIPETVRSPSGEVLFTGNDIKTGQQVFLKYGLMENGTIWGHGAYLGPDFSAEYLHTLTLDGAGPAVLKQNRYDPRTGVLSFSAVEASSYRGQIAKWADYFSGPTRNAGLPSSYISDPKEIEELTAFFAWTAWASYAPRPGKPYSYTNNFPYDPQAGNHPPDAALLWSALSLITLLGGIALVLFVFGKFDYLGWKRKGDHIHPQMIPGEGTASQRATIKYFVAVAALFLVQALVGGGVAHFRADPGSFYGFDVSRLFPSSILRTWHLQLAIFWVATAYVAGGLFLAPVLGGRDPKGQTRWTHVLFGALVLVVAGSLIGEYLGVRGMMPKLWFWLGHQGWEYLDLGRIWQFLLAAGLVLWLVLLFRAVGPSRRDPEKGQVSSLFLYAAIAIPLFYLPALFFGSRSNFTVVDTWRFWIIHLWVEGFFELFVTVMVAAIFYKLGIVSHTTAARVVYLDALLYLGSGIIGTGHHWYWTGQSNVTMALAAVFSAMEVVPLTLLTLDAWDFVRLTRGVCDVCHKPVSVPHKWTFYFLMSVGVWNFVGAGIFGFLINMPIVSYYEVGTILTANHGHAAMMGVFGMLAVALLVFAIRQVSSAEQWAKTERFVKVSFWGLNIGLVLMMVTSLIPGGIIQLADVLKNGYWHARQPEFLQQGILHTLEWTRLPGDMIFIWVGVVPLLIAVTMTYWKMKRARGGRG